MRLRLVMPRIRMPRLWTPLPTKTYFTPVVLWLPRVGRVEGETHMSLLLPGRQKTRINERDERVWS